MSFAKKGQNENEELFHAQPDTFDFSPFLEGLPNHQKIPLQKFFSLGQDCHVMRTWSRHTLESFVLKLMEMENFYKPIGGIVGYQRLAMQMLTEKKEPKEFSEPPYVSLESEDEKLTEMGLRHLPFLVEIYTCAGAADRLNKDASHHAPAATFSFLGKSLLQRLVDDVEGRESLYKKRFGKTVHVPIVITTSDCWQSHDVIVQHLKTHNYFGRDKESIRIIKQPLVPTFDKSGNWYIKEPESILWRPGGHGVLWHLLKCEGIYSWLAQKGITHALIRQINNPIAGVDYSLLNFIGLSSERNVSFSFASCASLPKAKEGRNVKLKNGTITNIEYSEWDKPNEKYLANTNVLFANLTDVVSALETHPFPGLLLNFKTIDKKPIARVESTMQNIAEAFPPERVLIAKLPRNKILSPIKHLYASNHVIETPESCLLAMQETARELLEKHCHSKLPEQNITLPFLFTYHPILGPTYKEIQSKLSHLTLHTGAHLHIEADAIAMHKTTINGSLNIIAKTPEHNITLEHCTIDLPPSELPLHTIWSKPANHKASLTILLHNGATFIAQGVTFSSPQTIIVKPYTTLVATQQANTIIFTEHKK